LKKLQAEIERFFHPEEFAGVTAFPIAGKVRQSTTVWRIANTGTCLSNFKASVGQSMSPKAWQTDK
jgi:hypothetical protein